MTTDGTEGISDASVYTTGSLVSGATQLIFFDEGTDAFMITVRSPSVDLTLNDAVALADRQAVRVPGGAAASSGGGWLSSSSWGYRVGEVFGALAAAALGVLAALALGHATAEEPGGCPHGLDPPRRPIQARRRCLPPATPGAPDAGWRPNPVQMNEELFWNGHEWAGRRRWLPGAGWVEHMPAHAP